MEIISITSIWLLAGTFFIAAEGLGLSGLGLLFLGLGALTVGGALESGFIPADDYTRQCLVWSLASAAWAAALWKVWKKYRNRHPHGHYSNIIGDTAYVGSNGLNAVTGGEVTWSGTIMNAALDKNAGVERLEAASKVTVTGMSGATLIVTPAQS